MMVYAGCVTQSIRLSDDDQVEVDICLDEIGWLHLSTFIEKKGVIEICFECPTEKSALLFALKDYVAAIEQFAFDRKTPSLPARTKYPRYFLSVA